MPRCVPDRHDGAIQRPDAGAVTPKPSCFLKACRDRPRRHRDLLDGRYDGRVIRNVVLHLHGELPLKADIESLPTAADAGLLCTNLRTLEGRKPLSTEFLDSVFLVPYNMIRFLEVPRESIDRARLGVERHTVPAQLPAAAAAAPEGSIIVTPPPKEPSEARPAGDALEDLEPDAELLRRIREA